MKRLTQAFALLGLCLLMAGCGSSAKEDSKQAAGDDPGPGKKSESGDTPEVKTDKTQTTDPKPKDGDATKGVAVIKSLEEIDALVASYKGKVVVIDMWATW